MLHPFGRLIAGVAAFAALVAVLRAEDLGPGPAPQHGVLLLRNGEVIEGKVTRAGELYYVALPGGEIRLKVADVERCCRTLDEGYQQKRAAIGPGDADGHLRLAQWCLRHGLPGYAGRELADVLAIDRSHPMIGPVERQLQMALAPPPTPPTPPQTVVQTADPAPSAEDLDRLVRSMPPGSVEAFTQTIQPLLTNHCGTAGCHGPNPRSDFRLLRGPAGRPFSRVMTQRNLDSVLAWVDRADPAASPLLTTPIRPHGSAEKAIFTDAQSSQYQRLVDWVGMVSATSGPRTPETVTSTEKPPVRAMPAERPATPAPAAAGDSPAIQRGAQLPEFTPADPFDPAIFNRRYFGNDESGPIDRGP